MLNTAIAAADAVQHRSEFDPWTAIGLESEPVVADLKSCRDNVLLRWSLKLRPARLSVSLMLLRLEASDILISTIILVSLAVVGLYQVPARGEESSTS